MRLRSSRGRLVAVLVVVVGCDPGVPAPERGICLFESGLCSYGALGGVCPPRPDEYMTVCVDTPAESCPETGSEVTVDAAQGQAYAEYTVNLRRVEGVSCEEYAAKPELDPEPLRTTCDSEQDGVCDAPHDCPDGTDVVDCAGERCEWQLPDDYECDRYSKYMLWCTNYAGGSRCAAEGSLFVCDGDVWMQASVLEIDSVCHSIGSVGYYGCWGAFDEFFGYCQ